MRYRFGKRAVCLMAALFLLSLCMAGCGSEGESGKPGSKTVDRGDKTEIHMFIAASLNTVMTDLAGRYEAEHEDVKIVYNADSSGTLMTQIKEGYECDIFFSAAQKQMNELEKEGYLVPETRADVVNNQLVVVSLKDSGTKVTGLANIKEAESIALAGGSVPAGRYTRQALMNMGIIPDTEEPASLTTAELSELLGGVEISEQDNVSKVLLAVAEGSCEVGTVYYSDLYGYEDRLQVLEKVGYDLTGTVSYPVAAVKNGEADEAQETAAREFISYILSDEAKEVFSSYYFDTETGKQ